MASLENRKGSWRVIFCHEGERRYFTLGEVSAKEAANSKGSTEELLRLLDRKLVSIPTGCSIEDFMYHRGKPPEYTALAPTSDGKTNLTLAQLRDTYFRSQEKRLEQTTLDGIDLHFKHLRRLLGPERVISMITRPDLQKYVDQRSEEWIDPNIYRKAPCEAGHSPSKTQFLEAALPQAEPPDKPLRHPSSATIKKEMVSLHSAWNWARRHLNLAGEFPGTGLDFVKIAESLPFMAWEEAERRIEAGDDPEHVWDCVYLRPAEVAELLEWVKSRPVSPWVYPMLCFAAHTGARRSEIVRALVSDLDLANSVVTIREKKRDKSKTTTRRVPLTPFLKGVLTDWMKRRAKGKTLFCKRDGKEITPGEATNYFNRGLRVSTWCVLRGLHVFRHSFISAMASKGIDQRIIDSFVGHSTEEQRRRYRHLFPDVTNAAMLSVFG